MTDFRVLCNEILQLLDYYIPEDDRPTCWDPWRQRARAVLARWETPNFAETRSSLGDAPQPVPVIERLPEPEDCDAEQQCWWWSPPTFERVGCWMLSRGTGAETHWLSFHVLPIPTAND